MAKKNKKGRNRRHKLPSLDALSAQELLEKGNLFLQRGKYQDAILCFKHLLKQDESEESLQALEKAYTGRIQSLAEKSMIKEAIALLETMVHRCPNARVDSLRLSLLLQAGSFAKAAGFLRQCRSQLEPEQLHRLEALFGALLLADVELGPEDFDESSLVARHYPLALEAMDLFFDRQKSKTHEALKQIPFRSPYRDLRTLLTGLLQLDQDKEKGYVFLRKIDKSSPYFHSAARYLTAAETPEDLLQTLSLTPKRDHRLIGIKYDLKPFQLRALCDLAGSGANNPLSLYQIVRKHGSCFDKKQKVELLKNIIPFCGMRSMEILPRHSEFDSREQYRIAALAAEKDGAFMPAVEFWDDYLEEIDLRKPAIHKEVALIMRYQAKLMQREYYEYSPQDVLETILESLEYDERHVQTWLDAAEFAKRHDSVRQYYSILNDATQKLPDEIPILVETMKACGNRGAYKKASGLAKRVLEIDPINTSALDFLVESRLEHGRKLASQKKWALAEKELQDADTRVKAIRFRGRNKICLGMLLLLQQDEEGLQLIAEGRQENGSPLLSHVLTSLESRLYRLPVARHKYFDRELRQAAGEIQLIEQSDFMRLIVWMLSFTGKQWLMLKETCQCLKKYYLRAAGMEWSLDEGLSICKALDRAGLTTSLAKCSARLQKKFPNNSDIKVWYLVGLFGKGNKSLPQNIHDTLEELMEELAGENRYDLYERLLEVMEKHRNLLNAIFLAAEEEDDDFFDDGPFRLPKNTRKNEERSKPRSTPKPVGGRQLNLFDDEL